MTSKPPARRVTDPFVRMSTEAFFRRHLLKAKWVDFAMQLHAGMVRAQSGGTADGLIHATVEEVAGWAGVSNRTAWSIWKRLRELGWVSCPSRGVIRFDYSRKAKPSRVPARPESAKVAETLIGSSKPSRMDKPIPSDPASVDVVEPSPSGGDGLSVEAGRAGDPGPSVFGLAVAALVEAGADRAGAVVAVRAARKVGALELGTVRRILEAVASMPSKPFRPGGLVCAAVARPELGRKIIRDAAWAASRRGKASRAAGGSAAAAGSPGDAGRPSKRPEVPPVLDRLEAMRRAVRDWLGLADPSDDEDRAWILRAAADRGWSRADLRAMPELRAWL